MSVTSVIIALLATGVAYLASSAGVRRGLAYDRRSDDPLRRAYAVDVAAVGQTASVGHAVVGGLAAFMATLPASVYGSVFLFLLTFAAFGVPVALWERRRCREIRS